MAIVNGTCVSFCNQLKAHYLVTSRESRRYVLAFTRFAGGGISLPQESLRHILASPGYAPGTKAVNVTWMKRGFNACQTHRSMYPSVFNRFPVIQPVSLKVRHFSTFFTHFGLPGYAPGTIAVNVTWMERGFNACKTPRCISPSIFNHFWDIAIYRWRMIDFQQSSWSEWAFFLPHFAFPLVRPWDNCCKCHTVGKRIQY